VTPGLGLACVAFWTKFDLKDHSAKNKTKGLIRKRVNIGMTANKSKNWT